MLFIDLSVDRDEKSVQTPVSMRGLFTQAGLEVVKQQPIIFSGFDGDGWYTLQTIIQRRSQRIINRKQPYY
jgi:hypothetical protein